jgi:hypothetical protein
VRRALATCAVLHGTITSGLKAEPGGSNKVPRGVYSGSRSPVMKIPGWRKRADGDDDDEDVQESHVVICSLNLPYSKPRRIIILSL